MIKYYGSQRNPIFLVHKEPDRWKAYLRIVTCFLGPSKNIGIEYGDSLQENMATRTLSIDIT
jgi:hypothetical protein